MSYIKTVINIFINYKLNSILILFYEFIYFVIHKNKSNKISYLNSNFLSNSIPCPYYYLIKINKFISKIKNKRICDLGCGFGKVVFFLGIVKKNNIDGFEYDKVIYNSVKKLENSKIKIYNKNILKLNYNRFHYNIYIINDPLKKYADLLKLINNLKKIKNNTLIIFINLNNEKKKLLFSNFFVIKRINFSNCKNIFFCRPL